ncbi:hypothetical protein [Actinacidiphila alni]|uniref:hypothetical protein n=1 Tax=Actinacidiphila alni TaxID=380248 RepID=UPI00345466C9
MTTDAAVTAEQTALVEEATKKSGLVWVDGQALWHAWVDDAMCVVGGGGAEQPLPPGLADGGRAEVVVRSKDKGGRLVAWTARVALLPPGGDAWEAAVTELKAKRLNSVDADTVTDRWARDCRVFRLTPDGPPHQHPSAMPATSLAAAPTPTPATTRHPIPPALPKLLTRRRKG